jgi:putative hydrolase of the HAD superfamily
MARITTLFFDAGGTLVHPNWRRIADELTAEGEPATPEALEAADARVRFELDRPEAVGATRDRDRWYHYLEAVARGAGLRGAPPAAVARLRAYHDEHNLWEDVGPGVPDALAHLGERYRLGLVSNANGTVRAKLARLGLARHFEVIVDSHEEGVEKPDPAIFRIALSRMGVRAEEAAYVGDLVYVDVTGARAAGLLPVLFDPKRQRAGGDYLRVTALSELGAVLDAVGPPEARGGAHRPRIRWRPGARARSPFPSPVPRAGPPGRR